MTKENIIDLKDFRDQRVRDALMNTPISPELAEAVRNLLVQLHKHDIDLYEKNKNT